LVRRAQIGLPLNEADRAAKRFYGLTADDVRAAFAKWIRADDFVQIVRGPTPQ
jgi:zinc protease